MVERVKKKKNKFALGGTPEGLELERKARLGKQGTIRNGAIIPLKEARILEARGKETGRTIAKREQAIERANRPGLTPTQIAQRNVAIDREEAKIKGGTFREVDGRLVEDKGNVEIEDVKQLGADILETEFGNRGTDIENLTIQQNAEGKIEGELQGVLGRTPDTTPSGQLAKISEAGEFAISVITGEEKLSSVAARIDPREASALRGIGLGLAVASVQLIAGGLTQVQTNQLPGMNPQIRAGSQFFQETGKTQALTKGMLGKWGAKIFTASAIVGAIGSYPFAGFIKEEALQTLGFATNLARESGDLVGEEEALIQTREVLDPTLWQQILTKIPYANVLVELEGFYDGARTKLEIDEKNFKKRREIALGNINA